MSGPRGPRRPPTAPISIRFTDSEKALLRARAAGLPLGTYIRSAVLADGGPQMPRRRRPALVDDAPLGRVLGRLGASRLSSNLNQLAKAANTGSLPVTLEVEAELKEACEDIRAMRGDLLAALGIEADGSPHP